MRLVPTAVRGFALATALGVSLGIGAAIFEPATPVSAQTTCETQTTDPDDTPTERQVISKVCAGQIADFRDDADPPACTTAVLRASFLVDLLTTRLARFPNRPRTVQIVCATVDGTVDLFAAEITPYFECRRCTFAGLNLASAHLARGVGLDDSSMSWFSVNGARVDGSVLLRGAHVYDLDDFIVASISQQLNLTEVTFHNPDKTTNLNFVTVGNTVFMKDATFAGPVTMAHAQIGGNLEADGAHFNGDHLTPDSTMDTHSFRLYGTTVKGVVYLRDAIVASAFVFSLAQMQSLDLSGTTFEGPVNLGASKVALDGRFEGTTFKDVTDLSDLSIGVVATFFKTTWPGNYPNGTPIPVNIGNMSYRTLYVTSSDTLRESTEWSDVRRLLERATYWSQNYTDLEAWYRRIGRIADADHVFVELRRHERPAEPVPNFVG